MRWLVILVVFVVTAIALYVAPLARTETADLVFGDVPVRARVLRTEAQLERGLSGTESLAPDEGALFVWSEPRLPAFWMKDMRFAIDIVWIAPDATVLGIEYAASPDTYPALFAPPASVGWVLELPAGTASRSGASVGMRVTGLPER